MAVKIRLARHGAKKRPYYRVVVADSMPGRSCGTAKTAIVYNTVKSRGWQASLSHRVMFSPPVPRKNTGAHTGAPARACLQEARREALPQEPSPEWPS